MNFLDFLKKKEFLVFVGIIVFFGLFSLVHLFL